MKSYTFRLKGGPGSGAHGHKGIPGHQGGGLPVGEGGPAMDANFVEGDEIDNGKSVFVNSEDAKALENLNKMFSLNETVKDAKNDVDMIKSNSNRYHREYLRNNDESRKRMYLDSLSALDKAKEKLDFARKELKINYKDVKAPGFGEWKFSEGERSVAGGWRYYEHPDHPEWGKVGKYSFGGWSMQRVAPNSSVSYNEKSFNWSGSNSRSSANDFMERVFGIK
jgi:hypothetical protein